ncbi:efflux RND transporter permease subunit [Legionella dresdenensis]|uniref:Efflux RND transporter permease subunit n=1 Tax=Legionella dresdenensis TaxID=450200 RepID=A0ABV8CHJ5_9GAMM
MLKRIINASLKYRWLVILLTLTISALGIVNFHYLPIDAVPDITNVQVQINTVAAGLTPLEVEKRITLPLETALSGMSALDYSRSLSRYGLSQITVVFKDNTDIYFARQMINERLQEARNKLPPDVTPVMGPVATGLGEIVMYIVDNPGNRLDATELRTIQDWVIKPQLRFVPGVAEINTVGGFAKQYHILPDPKKLIRYGLSLNEIVVALENNNANTGAGYIERNGEQYLIRVPGQIHTIKQIKNIVVASHDGTPVHIKDVAEISLGKELRTGAATADGKEVVLGTVLMFMGENSRTVAERVTQKLEQINKSLPPGTKIELVYNRLKLVDATINTVKNNLLEGAILVCAVLLIFLGNIRAALITAMVIPLSMLLTITGMVYDKISANLMSLGALDFGLIVDGAVIIVENCMKQLAREQQRTQRLLTRNERIQITARATQEVIRPSAFGVLIITAVYLPVLTLTGIEGKMFLPMAETVIIALLSSLLFSMTFIPAAIALFLKGPIKEKKSGWRKQFTLGYKHLLTYCLQRWLAVISLAIALAVISVVIAFRLGAEFVPSLNEGDIALHALRIPGTSLSQSIAMQHQLEKNLKKVPEVDFIFSKLGTAEIATDPMPPNVADTYIIIKPKKDWPKPHKTRAELIQAIEQAIDQLPGNSYEFSQPIQMRFNELISGVRSDVAVKIYGDQMPILEAAAEAVRQKLQKIAGAADVKIEQASGLPLLTLKIDRLLLARYGLQLNEVQTAIGIAMGGKVAGQLFEGDRHFDIVVRLPENLRAATDVLHNVFVPLPMAPDGERHFIPLTEIATFVQSEGPNQISRENGKRVLTVTANIRKRDLSSFVSEAKKQVEAIKLPHGYWLGWGGQFEQLQSATNRLLLVIPATFLLIYVLLSIALNSARNAGLVFTAIPLALTGGVFALWLRGIPLSISAAVGFIALSGIAVLNGLVMISFMNKLRESNYSLSEAAILGSAARLRPVLMTALVASLGFIPMAIATGTGAEVQRPLATVVIGGIISSTFLTLIVLPILYVIWHRKR